MSDYPTVKHVQKTTAFKKKRVAEGAIETLKWLEDGAESQFDGLEGKFRFNMGAYVCRNGPDCGTACCIAGAITAYVKKFNGDEDRYRFFTSNEMRDDFEKYEYGSPLHNLFYAVGYENDMYLIRPKEAAITLRKYLEEGIVDWSHTNE
jgi:hypothetical protein